MLQGTVSVRTPFLSHPGVSRGERPSRCRWAHRNSRETWAPGTSRASWRERSSCEYHLDARGRPAPPGPVSVPSLPVCVSLGVCGTGKGPSWRSPSRGVCVFQASSLRSKRTGPQSWSASLSESPHLEGCPGMSRLRLRVSRLALGLGLRPGSECPVQTGHGCLPCARPSLLPQAHGGG